MANVPHGIETLWRRTLQTDRQTKDDRRTDDDI